jgi:hypothetical protein
VKNEAFKLLMMTDWVFVEIKAQSREEIIEALDRSRQKCAKVTD